jgi:ABC-type branched-subunit amino acid transport system substrate-binding protein
MVTPPMRRGADRATSATFGGTMQMEHVGVRTWGRPARRWLALTAAVPLVLAATACGGDDGSADGSETDAPAGASADEASILGPVDRAEGEPVRVGFITDGQNATTDQSIELDVADATVQYLNEHQGGIAGRPIELVICEAKLDPAVGADCANQMVEEGVPVVAIGTTGVVESVWQPLHDAGVPTMFYAASGDLVLGDAETTFAISNPTAGNIQLPIQAAEDAGADKVTVIVIDVPAALAGYEGSGAEAFEDAGVDLELVRVPPGTADMTHLVGPAVEDDPGVVHVLGNDSFCISAFQALQTFGFDGPMTTITQCLSDATLQAVPGSFLEGVKVASPAPVGIEDESTELYRTVLETFGQGDVDTSRIAGVGTFLVLAGLDVSLEGLEGDVTPESVITTAKAMEEADLPGGGGITIQCDGTVIPALPAVCGRQGVFTTLDADGQPTAFEVTGG